MSSDLFKKWLQPAATQSHSAVSLYIERTGARSVGLEALKKLLADHFVGEATIVKAGGYSKSAKIIVNSLPTNKRMRSGDLGAACDGISKFRDFVCSSYQETAMEERSRDSDARK